MTLPTFSRSLYTLLLLPFAALGSTPLQSLIDAAIASNAPSLALPPNATFIQGTAPLIITSGYPFVLYGAGANIIFAPTAGVIIDKAQSLTVENLMIRYDPPCFTQGSVVNVNGTEVDVLLDSEFPDPDAPFFSSVETKLQFFYANGTRVPGQSGSCIVNVLTSTAPRVWRISQAPGFSCKFFPAIANLRATISPRVNAPGYQIPDGYVGGAYQVFNSTNVTTRGVTLLGSGNFAFSEWGGGGNHLYEDVTLARDSDRGGHLLSSNTDGFHSFGAGVGPTLRRAKLSFMGDDVINIHNRVGLVMSAEASDGGSVSALIIDVGDVPTPQRNPAAPSRAFAYAQPGDTFHISPQSAGANAGSDYVVSSIEWSVDPATIEAAQKIVAARHAVAVNPLGIGVWNVSLTGGGVISAGDVVQWDAHSGAGVRIEDSYFSDAYDSCGRLQAASDSIFSGNVWERIPGGVNIVFDPDWLEGASDIRNVLLTGNTFRDVLFPPATAIAKILNVEGSVVNFSQRNNVVEAS